MKPLGDAFIRLITMIITILIFCTVVTRHRRHAVRGLVNMIGNGVAMLVVARWENELERATLQHKLAQ